MLTTRFTRVIWGLSGLVLIAAITMRTVDAQQPALKGPSVDPKEEPRDGFGLPLDDKKAPRIIESVVKHLKADLPPDEWKDIITNLQAAPRRSDRQAGRMDRSAIQGPQAQTRQH